MGFSLNLMGNLGIMLFLIILGYSAKIKKESLDDIARLVVDYGLPALIFSSFVHDFHKDMLFSMSTVLVFAFLSAFVGYGVGFLNLKLLKLNKDKFDEFLLASVYGNTGYIGIPVCLAIFGREGAILAVTFDLSMTFVLFTFGLFLLLGKNQSSLLSIFKKLLNPPIMALFAGLFFGLTDIKINSMVLSGITTLGAMTTPLAMIFVGGMLSQIKSIKWYGKELTSLIATRLIIVPLFMFVLIKIFGIAGVTASVILLEAATPTMVNAPLLYQRYKGEAVFSTSAVFITTLLCIITIPVLMLLL